MEMGGDVRSARGRGQRKMLWCVEYAIGDGLWYEAKIDAREFEK